MITDQTHGSIHLDCLRCLEHIAMCSKQCIARESIYSCCITFYDKAVTEIDGRKE